MQRLKAHILGSPNLWATVDVCMTATKPMIGIRGSMPGDGHRHDAMYMRFLVQYMQAPGGHQSSGERQGSSEHWTDLPGSADSGFVKAGAATGTRQAGRSFQLAPVQSGQSFRLRGLVEFQWRHGSQVRLTALRPTTANHHSLAGAIPQGFSAATCTIG